MNPNRIRIKILIAFLIISISPSLSSSQEKKWYTNKENWSTLMLAVYKDDRDTIQLLIKKNSDMITYKVEYPYYLNALIIAIRMNNFYATKELIETGKFHDLNFYFDEACGAQSTIILDYILGQGVDIHIYPEGSQPFLLTACSFSSVNVVEFLLEKGADVNSKREGDGITGLMLAAYKGDIQKVKVLLKYNADKAVKDESGKIAYDYIDMAYNLSNQEKDTLMYLLHVDSK